MNSRGCHSPAGGRARAVLAGASILGAWTAPALADPPDAGTVTYGTTIVPHLGAAASWTDNILLAPPGDTADAEIWQLLPGIYLKHDSQNFHITLDYEVQGYFYDGGEHGHQIFQNGNLFADTQLLPDWFFVDLGGNKAQGTVDPNVSPAVSALFPTGNLANETSASATPIIRHKFEYVQLDARYGWGFTRYQNIGAVPYELPNTDNQDGSFRLSSIDQNARVTWDASYLRQTTTYTDVVEPRWLDEDANADLGVLVAPGLRLLGQYGRESDLLTSVSAGGFGATSWSGGFDWTPDLLNEVKLMAGRRFFGNTYEALVKHQSRLLTLQVSYSEEPETFSNRFLPQGPSNDLVVIPGVPQFQRLTSDAYLMKLLDARLALTGRLTEIGLDVFSSEQNYFTVNGIQSLLPVADQYRGASLYMTRHMGAQLQGMLSATFDHTDLREGAASAYNDQHYTARLTDQVGLRTTVTLSLDHWVRTGSQLFTVNMVTLSANMYFGNGPTGLPGNSIVPNPVTPGTTLPVAVAPPFLMHGPLSPAAIAMATSVPATAAVPVAP
jgi:hypothetical protein